MSEKTPAEAPEGAQEAASEAAKAAPREGLTPDAWTARVPRPVHWLLTLATLGLWRFVWRYPAKAWLLAALSGALMFLSFAGWDMWYFGFVFMVPMFAMLDRCTSAREAWWLSLLTGWIANFGGFYWISGLLMDFGQMPAAAAVGICLIMTLYQGVAFAAFGALVHTIRSRVAWPLVAVGPVVWVACELLMPLIFPYYLGNSQYLFPPMIQVAELLGPLAVSALLIVANGALYDALRAGRLERGALGEAGRRRVWIGAGVGLALVALNIGYGVVRIGQVREDQAAADKLKIGMVEGDIGIFAKEAADKVANNLIIHQQLSKQLADEDKVDLIVWPESAYQAPTVFSSKADPKSGREALEASTEPNPRGQPRRAIPRDATWLRPSSAPLPKDDSEDQANGTAWPDRVAPQRGFGVPLLMGAITYRMLTAEDLQTRPPNKKMRMLNAAGEVVRVPRNYRVYNSAVLIDGEGFVQGLYDKNYLLAFGEYIPGAGLMPWLYDLIPAASEFTPGTEVEVFEFKGHRLGVMICYEDILPNFGRKLAKKDPHVLINVTNDAWFGKTNEPYLHLALATFRAVEARKWLLRSTNTGVTAFIDATGEIVSQTRIYDPEVLAREVPMLKGGPTLYVMIGDVLGYLALLGTALMVFVARRRGGA